MPRRENVELFAEGIARASAGNREIPRLLRKLRSPDFSERALAGNRLAALGPPIVLPLVIAMAGHRQNPGFLVTACAVLRQLGEGTQTS